MTTDRVPDWTLLGSALAFDGYVRVRRDRYRLPDGSESDWDVVEIGDTVAVVALTPDDTVVLFDQFRVGPRRVLGELPGGLIDAGEDAVGAGVRELREETGYRAGAVFDAGAEWAAANGRRRRHVVIAVDCVPAGEPTWGEHESGRIRTIPSSELLEHLTAGEVSDGGAAVRGLVRFALASDVAPALRAAQHRVRRLLAGAGEQAQPGSAAAAEQVVPDPYDAFWHTADGKSRESLWLELDALTRRLAPGTAIAAYERASLHDYLGEEADAIPLYREALDAGLAGERRSCAIIQLASSLRNVGDASGALALLHRFPADDPLADAARAFEALALFSDHKPAPALRVALRALAPHLPAYRRSIDAYAGELAAPARIRAISVAVVVRDGHVLAEEYVGGPGEAPFLRAPGGGIEFGESAEAAMRRELREELGVEATATRLLAVTENIFDHGRKRGHEIAHVFAVQSAQLDAMPFDERRDVLDGDTTVGWYRIDELRAGTTAFYPSGILDLAIAASADPV
ncbi:tetratricopeptide repeat protein [Microbacterium sp. cf332]|uniref:tetratricopeptide repeat protein n=1 Tax=Microbacterium sp. cf332 TaxID=1761804 RepID=UPI0008812192|nr:tetratricopeptide repeat protein [Microbacterium sp. cf332]SDQ14995.1 ADP-ribose pyrophosphatase YjhB, NUDIX family [Microbacterium sp. cf332]